jgi:hypothetical protein
MDKEIEIAAGVSRCVIAGGQGIAVCLERS